MNANSLCGAVVGEQVVDALPAGPVYEAAVNSTVFLGVVLMMLSFPLGAVEVSRPMSTMLGRHLLD